MQSRFVKALLALATVAALSTPGIAQASHGSDDPAGHVQREHHRVERHHRQHHDRQHHRDRRDNDRGDDHGRDR